MGYRGNRSKLTDEAQEKILQLLKAGNYMETAANYAGVSIEAVQNWLRKGAVHERGRYHNFYIAVQRALAEAEARDVATVGQAAQEKWEAAAWRLERKHPGRWSKVSRTEITGRGGQPVQVAPSPELQRLSNKDLETVERFLEKGEEPVESTAEEVSGDDSTGDDS